MTKFTVIFSISIALIVFLVAGAFVYVDISGRTTFDYSQFAGDKLFARTKISRYSTEDKIVYKSKAEYYATLDYPKISRKMFFKKKGMFLQKFIEEAKGVKRQKRLMMILHKGEKTDFLFLEPPRFISVKDFEAGRKTLVLQPYDIMSYMPIVDKYNFWKKGTQYFEIMIPLPEEIPLLRDIIAIRHLDNEYITVIGSRVEAESYIITARSIPEVKVIVAKHTHRILALEFSDKDTRFILTKYSEGHRGRMRPFLEKIKKMIFAEEEKEDNGKEMDEEDFPETDTMTDWEGSRDSNSSDIFFDSPPVVLSGRLWLPEGEEKYPAVILMQKDGPVTKGTEYLSEELSRILSESGFAVLTFDYPGYGKSQGGIVGLDDEKRIKHISAAVKYLRAHPNVEKGKINLLGHKGGGYLAVETAKRDPLINTCVLLGLSPGLNERTVAKELMDDVIQRILEKHGVGPFKKNFIDMIKSLILAYNEEILTSSGRFSFFKGIRLPLKEYRDFLSRKPYNAMLSFDRPVLLVLGRDDRYFDALEVEVVSGTFERAKGKSKASIHRKIGEYVGTMEEQGDSWSFEINSDAVSIINSWLKACNGVISKNKDISPNPEKEHKV